MAGKRKVELTDEQKAAKKAEREAAKAENFKRLAEARTGKALDALAALRALANKNTYSYTTVQVAAIFAALEGELSTLQTLFAPGAVTEEKKGFVLPAPTVEVAA